MKTILPFVLASAALLVVVSGCGEADDSKQRFKVFPVEGKVTQAGKPVADALVVLHPKDTSNPKVVAARAKSDKDGKFKVTTYVQNDGAIPGEYAVTVVATPAVKGENGYEAGPNILPPKYATPASTDISIRVAEGPNQVPPIELR